MRASARVPGKAVLTGEYAVTDGVPAIAMGVDRYACVELTTDDIDSFHIRAPQLEIDALRFEIGPGRRVEWQTDHPQWSRFAMTAGWIERLLGETEPGTLAPFRLQIDTAELFLEHQGEQIKLGLGSSAAVLVGLDQVLADYLGRESDQSSQHTLDRLLPIYRDGQGGQGSGIDLACSIFGGLIEFRGRSPGPEIRPTRLPAGLELLFVWTGQSASTPDLLARYRDWQQRSPARFERWIAAAASNIDQVREALDAGDAPALIELFRAYGRAMSTIGGFMGVDLTPGVHRALMEQADRLGLAAKPSGAGVGDLALVAGNDPRAMERMRQWLRDHGHPALVLSPASAGARLDGCGDRRS
jgi:phosphomevalonate kinase